MQLVLAGMAGRAAIAVDVASPQDVGALTVARVEKLDVLQVVVAIALEQSVALARMVGRDARAATLLIFVQGVLLSQMGRVGIEQLPSVRRHLEEIRVPVLATRMAGGEVGPPVVIPQRTGVGPVEHAQGPPLAVGHHVFLPRPCRVGGSGHIESVCVEIGKDVVATVVIAERGGIDTTVVAPHALPGIVRTHLV